jgi:predicted secreted protein
MTLRHYKDSNGEWRWQVISSNGNVVANSGEGYKNRKDCVDIAEKLFTPGAKAGWHTVIEAVGE